MRRFLTICLALLVLVGSAAAQTAVEYVNQKLPQKSFNHDYFLQYVLFGRTWTSTQDPTYDNDNMPLSNLAMIEYACLLCIDQFNNNQDNTYISHQTKLNRLRKKVPGLPKSIDETNPNKDNEKQLSGTNHRTYTHHGWKFNYEGPGRPGNLARSEKRETILRNTVAKVFQFRVNERNIKTKMSSIGPALTEEDRCESYCRLFYYIHLLGDCYEDENYKQANGSNNGQKMPLGRANPSKSYVDDVENSDIITEFIWVCEELFSSSSANSENYPHLMKELKRVEGHIRSLYKKTGGVNSSERYEEYHMCTCELMQVLMVNLHNLLKNEADFVRGFSEFLN